METNVELQAACSSLGYLEKGTYFKEPDCLETIKDIIRFLKREDESCDVRRQIGDSQIVQNDLLPIIKQYKEDIILLETTLRLLVNLTQPAVLCFQNQIPGDKTNRNFFLQIEAHLQSYKQAFSDEALLAVLTRKLGDLLQLDWENRQEEDRLLIERILILIRNVLHVPPNSVAEGRTDDDASIHDQFLWALHVSGMEDLLLYLGSSEEERQFAFHVLETVSLMFREQTPEQLASAGGARALSERQQDQRDLEVAREQEKLSKKGKTFKYSSRHSRFGGTFTMVNVKSISDNQMITHRSLGQIKDMDFDHNKRPKRIAKNRKPLKDDEATRRSTLSIRIFLKEFCIQFLENCYNPLMRAVKDILVRSRGQDNDETYYLWAMRFFMEFNRKQSKHIRVDLVGETMSVQSFHYVQTNLQTYHEMIFSNKKEGKQWSRRMHLALKAYQELLQTVNAMTNSRDSELRENAEIIKGNVFYMMEYRDIFLVLLKKFNEALQSRAFLRDLIETTHLFVKMLEFYCKKHGHLVVQKKRKKSKKKKKKETVQAETTNAGRTEQELEDLWDTISGDLSAIFQGRGELPNDVAPFDAASEVEVDQQRAEAMIRIQTSLRENRPGEAVALFRAAREVWPEQEQFGSENISPEEEFMALREVFFADIPRPETQVTIEEEEDVSESSNDEEHEAEVQYESMEQEFDFKNFVKRFSQPMVVKAYGTLLRDYKKNTTYTNHCIIKQLHRIGFECSMVALLFQASLFRVFQKIMCDPACNTSHLQELVTFSKYVARKFFEVVTTNPKVFVELLFWKTPKEAFEITEGYGTQVHQVKQHWTEEQDNELSRLYEEYKDQAAEGMDVIDHIMVHFSDRSKTRKRILKQLRWLNIIESTKDIQVKKAHQVWTEEQDEELNRLFEEFKDQASLGMDVVDHIMVHILDDTKNRKNIIQQLKKLGLIESTKEILFKKSKQRGWQEEEEVQLRTLFDEFKESDDPVNNIMNGLDKPKPRQSVLNKLLSLGLIQDKRELRKRGKSGGPRKKRHSDNEDEFIEKQQVAENSESDLMADSSSSSEGSDDESDTEDPLYVVRIRKSVKRSQRAGHTEAIEWFGNCLGRCADDREEDEDDDQPIPIVPLTEEQETAMEDKCFQTLLKNCGIKPPADEQERFWRIPAHLKPDDLRSRVTALKPKDKSNEENTKKKVDKEKFEALKQLAKNGSEGKKRERKERSPRLSAKKSRVKRTLPSDSESDDASGMVDEANTSRHSKKQRITISDDEESDKENTQSQPISSNESFRNSSPPKSPVNSETSSRSRSQQSNPSSRPPSRSGSEASSNMLSRPSSRAASDVSSKEVGSDQEEENTDTTNLQTFPATMLSQPMSDDDSDIDDHIPLKQLLHKRATRIASDSDED